LTTIWYKLQSVRERRGHS